MTNSGNFFGPIVHMDLASTAERLAARLQQTPLIRPWAERRYRRRFAKASQVNWFRGVYEDFDAARSDMPDGKPAGYDHPAPARMYRDRMHQLSPSDYPALFWLSRLAPQAGRIFDFGGHVGLLYYAFGERIRFSPGLQWQVCDVPAVVDSGRSLAAAQGASALSFTTRIDDGDGADILFASGSLQYLEAPLHELIAAYQHLPRHILINLTPMHPNFDFTTLQNIGTAFCPYRIFRRQRLLDGLTDLGYQLRDEWLNPDKRCPIPFHPDHSVPAYSGFLLERK